MVTTLASDIRELVTDMGVDKIFEELPSDERDTYLEWIYASASPTERAQRIAFMAGELLDRL